MGKGSVRSKSVVERFLRAWVLALATIRPAAYRLVQWARAAGLLWSRIVREEKSTLSIVVVLCGLVDVEAELL